MLDQPPALSSLQIYMEMARTYQAVVLRSWSTKKIIPGQTFEIVNKPCPREQDLKDGEVICETSYLSLDPAMRGFLIGRLAYF